MKRAIALVAFAAIVGIGGIERRYRERLDAASRAQRRADAGDRLRGDACPAILTKREQAEEQEWRIGRNVDAHVAVDGARCPHGHLEEIRAKGVEQLRHTPLPTHKDYTPELKYP